MRTMKRLIMSLILGATAMTYAGSASAQEYVLILLDQTGSMCSNLSPCPADSPWHNAIADAKLWVQEDANENVDAQRFYSIWTFKNTQDGVQDGAVQLWPSPTFADGCPTGSTFGTIGRQDPTTAFCEIRPSFQPAYTAMQTLLTGLETKTGEVPQATWLTTLADGICRSLSKVWLSTGQQVERTLILESDGGENSSAVTRCYGTDSVAMVNDWGSLNMSVPDWGWDVGSWQSHVLRRATRLLTHLPPAFGSDPSAFDAKEREAIDVGPLTSTSMLPTDLTLKISPHYTLCSPLDTDPVCVHKNGSTAMAQAQFLQFPGTGATVIVDGPAARPLAAFSVIGATAAATTTAGGPPRVPTMDPPELAFFRTLGTAPRAKLRTVVRDPGGVFGRGHAVQGDVDDSGCTSNADYSIVTQSDVWLKQAVRPLEIAIRADLNKDGWVDEKDRSIVIANWGKGCINPPGPRPIPVDTCGDGVKNASETDVDCGSSSCSDCKVAKACLVNADCLSDSCVSNVCAAVNNISATLAITQDWGGGYCVEVGATNRHASKATKNWTLTINTGASAIYTQWGGTRVGNTGSVVVKPGAGNMAVLSGATNVNVGFCANRTVAGAPVFPTVTATTATY
jgi:hypothetical protein